MIREKAHIRKKKITQHEKMSPQEFPSKLLESAVSEFAKLPGIGRKTALRFALHMLRQPLPEAEKLAMAIAELRREVRFCQTCHNISDDPECSICRNPKRNADQICVVETIRDVMAIESTGQFHGMYHVLGGLISPMDGIGPSDLEIESLMERVAKGSIREIIFALAATMEGDTTAFYLNRKLSVFEVEVSVIARGVSVGDDLEYADEITLGRSILNRLKFNMDPKTGR
jgi:recombination protein RecR